jgi:dihydroorotase
MRTLFGLLAAACAFAADPVYDLVLRGGHVIDPKNKISRVIDIGIQDGKIARIAPAIPPAEARRVANVSGLYVTPGLIDIHVHVYTGTGIKALTGDSSVYPDGFSFRAGVTTMVDAGTAGWRNFPDFRQRVIDRAQTRVLALLNISGAGMGPGENAVEDFDPEQAARMAKAHPDIIVGFKTAHYAGPGWIAIDNLVKAGELTGLPAMVDFGTLKDDRNLRTLLLDKLRPGDLYTHCYSSWRGEMGEDGRLNPVMLAARKRGVLFDVGHGGGSFFWWVAVPAFEEKFYPDVISTDLHTGSMNAGMKDLPNVMSKVLNFGVPLDDVVAASTWRAAQAIRRTELGHLDLGAEADITVLRLEKGQFGFIDSAGARRAGTQRLSPELTIRKGKVVWDLNGRAAPDWKTFPYKKQRNP